MEKASHVIKTESHVILVLLVGKYNPAEPWIC